MKILLFGASGFIGSALTPMLRADGHTVVRALRYVSGRFDSYEQPDAVFADLRDSYETRQAVLSVKPDLVINLAAQSAVAYSFKHPEEVGEVDFMGVVRIAEACKDAGVPMVHASTSEVYGRGDHVYPLTEDQQIGGTSPYAAAKVAAENYLRVLASTNPSFKFVILRPFNTIGRALVRNRHFVVERAITQAIEDHVINLHDPAPLRDFLFRTDHAGAYRAVVQYLNSSRGVPTEILGEAFNACTGDAWTIEEMARHVALVVGKRTGQEIAVRFAHTSDRPLDIARLQGSNEKIHRMVGWKPEHTIASAIEKAVDEWLEVLR